MNMDMSDKWDAHWHSKPPNPERTIPMTLFNTQDPAIADSFMLVCDALTEIEDTNLYERQGTSAVDDAQYVLAMAVRNQHKDMRRAARQLVDAQIDRTPLVVVDDEMEVAA